MSEEENRLYLFIFFLINRKKKFGINPITKLIYKGKCYTDKASIAHQLNTHFMNVGRELADQIPKGVTTQTNILNSPLETVLISGVYLFTRFMTYLWE